MICEKITSQEGYAAPILVKNKNTKKKKKKHLIYLLIYVIDKIPLTVWGFPSIKIVPLRDLWFLKVIKNNNNKKNQNCGACLWSSVNVHFTENDTSNS